MRNLSTKRITPLSWLIASACLVAFFGVIAANSVRAADKPEAGQRLLTINDRGNELGIMTSATSLRQAFAENDIKITNSDLVEPSLDEKLVANSYQVNIYRARPVLVVDGAMKYKILTPYQTDKQVAKHAGLVLQDEDETTLEPITDVARHGLGVQMTIKRATQFNLVMYGKKITAYTMKATVGEMLKSKGVKLGDKDSLSVSQESPIASDMTIEIWREGKQTITVEEELAFEVEKIQDADRDPSYRQVKTAGEKGAATVTYEIVMKNGKEVSRQKIQSVTTKKPTTQVEVIGAKFVYTGGPLSDAQIQALGSCESGMTATRNSGNGFYGAFQFMPSTWRVVAPAPYNQSMPHEAPLDAQKQAVQNLLSRSSIFTQFPGCAKKMRANGVI